MVELSDHIIHTDVSLSSYTTSSGISLLMNAVSENASGKTKKKMKMPAFSSGMVTMPMEYLQTPHVSVLMRNLYGWLT